MRQVKRAPEDPELTDDEIKTAIENAGSCAGEFVRRVKENGDSPMLADASGYGQAADTIQVAVNEWRELYFGGPR